MRQEGRNAPDGAGLSFGVVEGEITLGGGIEFQHLRNAEALLEVFPHIARQPVAHRKAQLVFGDIAIPRQQIAAQLTDILEDGGAAVGHIAPEAAAGEFLAQNHRATRQQHRARRHNAAHAVIHGQAVVQAVVRPRARHAGEPVGPAHHPAMADMCRLGQARGAGGIDQQRTVIQRDITLFVRRQGCAGKGIQQGIERRALPPQLRLLLVQFVRKGRGGDNVPWARHRDAMGQRLTLQVGVQQRHDAADARDPQPGRQIVGTIGHQQTDHVALGDILAQGPSRHPVGPRRQLAMAVTFVGSDQRRRFAEACTQFFNHDGKGARGRILDFRRHLQRAQPGFGRGRLFLHDRRGKRHGCLKLIRGTLPS